MSTTLEPRDFRGLDFEAADSLAKDEAERMAESNIQGAIDENLPDEEDQGEWNWEALAKFANVSWGLNLRDRDLKKIGRDSVDEFLIEKAQQAVRDVDLSDGEPFLHPDFGLRSTVAWVQHKFGVELSVEDIRGLELPKVVDLVVSEASTLQRSIALARVPAGAGEHCDVDIRGQHRRARIVRPAFVRRGEILLDIEPQA